MTYSDNQQKKLTEAQKELDSKLQECQELLIQSFSHKLQNDNAKKYLLNGVCRRLQAIQRSSNNIFSIFPPNQNRRLDRDSLIDVDIFLQNFVINIYGVLDNLAWIFVYENQLESNLKHTEVGLHMRMSKQYFPEPLKNHVNAHTFKNWFNFYAKNYRDACSHRIPVYVPPYRIDPTDQQRLNDLEFDHLQSIYNHDWLKVESLSEEIESLKFPLPLFLHESVDHESKVIQIKPIWFHPQILCDILTILELIDIFKDNYKT